MSEKKPQIYVKFKSGERAVFDIEDESDFRALRCELNYSADWVFLSPVALVNKNQIDSIFYLQEGYAENSQNHM